MIKEEKKRETTESKEKREFRTEKHHKRKRHKTILWPRTRNRKLRKLT